MGKSKAGLIISMVLLSGLSVGAITTSSIAIAQSSQTKGDKGDPGKDGQF